MGLFSQDKRSTNGAHQYILFELPSAFWRQTPHLTVTIVQSTMAIKSKLDSNFYAYALKCIPKTHETLSCLCYFIWLTHLWYLDYVDSRLVIVKLSVHSQSKKEFLSCSSLFSRCATPARTIPFLIWLYSVCKLGINITDGKTTHKFTDKT